MQVPEVMERAVWQLQLFQSWLEMTFQQVAPVERCAIASAKYKVVRLTVLRVLPRSFQTFPHGCIQGNLAVTGIGLRIVKLPFIETLRNLDTILQNPLP